MVQKVTFYNAPVYMSHALAYNGAQTTMVVSVDRVSHANGWSFHSDLPGLTRDVNVDTEHEHTGLTPAVRERVTISRAMRAAAARIFLQP